MKKAFRKHLSLLLAAVMVFGMFAAMPLTSYAQDAVTLRNTIEAWPHGGTGTLTVTLSGNTVTVESNTPVTNIVNAGTFNIDPSVTVIWKADISGAPVGELINITGKGKFELASGGSIKNTGPDNAIKLSNDTDSEIIISGGTVSAVDGVAIQTGGGKVTVSGGIVNVTGNNGYAIFDTSDSAVINVSGGTVKSDSNKPTIAAGKVTVSGNAKIENTVGDAIYAANSVTVNGGVVSAKALTAIAMWKAGGSVTVSGGRVESEGPFFSHAIGLISNGSVVITGGEIKSVGDEGTIRAFNQASITISGGQVKAESNASSMSRVAVRTDGVNSKVTIDGSATVNSLGYAIKTTGGNSTIEIKNGKVTGIFDTVTSETDDSLVQVTGGTVENTGVANAINAKGAVEVAGGVVKSVSNPAISIDNKSVTVKGGTVCATTGEAILTAGSAATVKLDGGFVFAYGTAIFGGTKNVIKMASGSPAINAPAVACAWDKPITLVPYDENTDVALKVLPAGASAKWGKDGSQSGIKYENGENKGFFPINEPLTINAAAPVTFNVTFNTNGGEPANFTKAVNTGEKAAKPADPTKAGFTFDGWFKEEALTTAYDFNTAVTANITLYAKWTEEAPAPAATPAAGSMSNFIKKNTYVSGQFTDVDENEWYGFNKFKSVANAFEYGLMVGDSATKFNPTGDIKISEAVTVAVRVHSIYMTGSDVSYTPTEPWYKPYVDYAVRNEIISATDFSNYDRAATRAEMAYIFSRSLPADELAKINTVNSLPDVSNTFSSATGQPVTPYYSAIIKLYEAGVIKGNDAAGTFNPGANIIRAEAAAIISRVILPSTREKNRTFG